MLLSCHLCMNFLSSMNLFSFLLYVKPFMRVGYILETTKLNLFKKCIKWNFYIAHAFNLEYICIYIFIYFVLQTKAYTYRWLKWEFDIKLVPILHNIWSKEGFQWRSWDIAAHVIHIGVRCARFFCLYMHFFALAFPS